MKITEVLLKQHIGRMIQRHWYIQGKIKVIHTVTEKILRSRGHEVVDIKKFLYPPKPLEKIEIVGAYDREFPKDKNHPDYKEDPCFIFKDEDVLIEGLEQAKVFTNTVEISEGLPEKFIEEESKLTLSKEFHSEVENKIKLSCIFEATQEKLPKRKDPQKPTFNFPREYGLTNWRKMENLSKNLVTICDQHSKNMRNRSLIQNAFFSCPLEAHNKKIQLELTSELLITRGSKFKILAEPSLTHNISVPELHPLECTAGLNHFHFYEMQHIYPPGVNSRWPYVQTALVYCDLTVVKNIIEEELTEEQIQGRSLLKGFCIAVAEARAIFGHGVKNLPEPVVVPVIQTDGKMFHFTAFQLNTLDIDKNSKVKNIFWNSPRIPLYSVCEYRAGRPILEEYNPHVIEKLIAFYNIE